MFFDSVFKTKQKVSAAARGVVNLYNLTFGKMCLVDNYIANKGNDVVGRILFTTAFDVLFKGCYFRIVERFKVDLCPH